MSPPRIKLQNGFSLIELLVVVSIMVTVLSLGVASYNAFSNNQILDGATKTLRANLRLAQTFSINGEKIGATCTGTFNGYYFVMLTGAGNNDRYAFGQNCNTDTPRTPPSPVILPAGVTISALSVSPLTIKFKSVSGVEFWNCGSLVATVPTPCYTTAASGPVTITLSASGLTSRTVTVTADGRVQ